MASLLLLLSLPLVAIVSSLLCSIWLLRPPALAVQQHLLSLRATAFKRQDSAIPCTDQPPVWPESLIVVQRRVPDADSKVSPATTITYYDYKAGGNLIQIFPTGHGKTGDDSVLWDLELNSGHSYYFYPSQKSCRPINFTVGILKPNWLEGATSLGPSKSWDGSERTVCGWTKVDFIDYYADAKTGVPDSWYFHTMKASFQVLDYTPNAQIDKHLFVPPKYCNGSMQ